MMHKISTSTIVSRPCAGMKHLSIYAGTQAADATFPCVQCKCLTEQRHAALAIFIATASHGSRFVQMKGDKDTIAYASLLCICFTSN